MGDSRVSFFVCWRSSWWCAPNHGLPARLVVIIVFFDGVGGFRRAAVVDDDDPESGKHPMIDAASLRVH